MSTDVKRMGASVPQRNLPSPSSTPVREERKGIHFQSDTPQPKFVFEDLPPALQEKLFALAESYGQEEVLISKKMAEREAKLAEPGTKDEIRATLTPEAAAKFDTLQGDNWGGQMLKLPK